MNHLRRNNVYDVLGNIPTNRLAWLWLVIGLLLLPFTMFGRLIPLAGWLAPIFLLRFVRTSGRTKTSLLLVFVSYMAGNLIATSGTPFDLLGLLGNVLFKGLVWTLPYAVDHFLSRRLKSWARVLVFPCAFTTLDWGLSLLRVSSSGSPAYSQAGNLALMQLVSITGMWGITFLIMWCTSLANELWEHSFNWRPLRDQLGLFAAVLAAAFLFGGLRLSFAAPSSQKISVATITIDSAVVDQATHGIDWLNFNRASDAERAALRPKLEPTVDTMLASSETALREGAKLVGWQESAAWVLDEDKPGVLERAAALAKRYDATLQIALEVFDRTQNTHYLHNQSILIDPTGRVLWTYDKTHPVPYGEAFVTVSGAGKLPVVDTSYGRMSTAICYDTYFPALIRQAGENHTDIFLAPTNDSQPFAASALVMASYRAIENGFSVVRPTGKGLSAVIDTQGRVLAIKDYFKTGSGIMLASVPTQGVTTIYSRIGDLLAQLCAAGLVFMMVWALLRRKEPATISIRQTA